MQNYIPGNLYSSSIIPCISQNVTVFSNCSYFTYSFQRTRLGHFNEVETNQTTLIYVDVIFDFSFCFLLSANINWVISRSRDQGQGQPLEPRKYSVAEGSQHAFDEGYPLRKVPTLHCIWMVNIDKMQINRFIYKSILSYFTNIWYFQVGETQILLLQT